MEKLHTKFNLLIPKQNIHLSVSESHVKLYRKTYKEIRTDTNTYITAVTLFLGYFSNHLKKVKFFNHKYLKHVLYNQYSD